MAEENFDFRIMLNEGRIKRTRRRNKLFLIMVEALEKMREELNSSDDEIIEAALTVVDVLEEKRREQEEDYDENDPMD
jgi:hypothetical protein